MTQQKENSLMHKIQVGLISLLVLMAGIVINTAGNIYKNVIILKEEMQMIREQQDHATLERDNIRLHQNEQDIRLSQIEILLQSQKNKTQ